MKRLVLVLSLGLGACAHNAAKPRASSTAPANPPAAPSFDINAHLAREAPAGAPQSIVAPDQSFRAEVPAQAVPTLTQDRGTWSVVIPIGSQTPIDCAVRIDQRLDAAALLHKLAQEPVKKFEKHGLQRVDAGVMAGHPYLTLETYYVTADKRIGLIKATVVSFAAQTIACVHDELGYGKTMARVVEELARTIRFARPAALWRFHDIAVLEAAGRKVAFIEHVSIVGPDKVTREIEYGAMMLPSGPHEVRAEDMAAVSSLDAKGEISSGTFAMAKNGALTTQVKLMRAIGKLEYHVEGSAEGKQINNSFVLSAPLQGWRRDAAQLVAHNRAASTTPLERTFYDPDLNPHNTTVRVLERQADSSKTQPKYRYRKGDKEWSQTHDAQGLVEHVEGAKVSLTRVFIEGAP